MKKVQTQDRLLQQIQTNIADILDPISSNLLVQGHFIKNIQLISGTNTIPTGLNQNLNGWIITRLRSLATIYDNQDNNITPSQNLILISNASTNIDLYVF